MDNNDENNEYKNELCHIFLEKLVTLYNKRDYDEIEKILIGKNESTTYNFPCKINGATYVDDNTVVDVRVWTDEITKSIIDVLYYVCRYENMIISLNNKMIKWWLYSTNTEISKFTYRNKKFECNKDCRLTIKIEKDLWDEFIARTKVFNVTIPAGFKICINDFLEQKARIHL